MLLTLISCRTTVNVSGVSTSLRTIVSSTDDPGLPRIFSTALDSGMPRVAVSSILTIRSPALMPALNAGVSSIGETTRMTPSSTPTSIPRPPKRPWVSTCNSWNASASRKSECGSRPRTIPLIASLISLSSGTAST